MESGASSQQLTKDQRVNLINRRTVAYLVEVSVVFIVLAAPVALLGGWFSWVGFPAYFALRDMVGPASFGKTMVGLGLAEHDSDAAPGASGKILRNVLLIIPLVPLVEFFVAYYGNNEMQRLGDKLGKTRVVDLDPHGKGIGSWTGQLVGMLIVTYVAIAFVGAAIAGAVS